MAMAIGLVGGMVSAVGSIFSGNAQAAMYNYQAQIAQMNAGIAKQQAATDVALGEEQTVQRGLQGAQQKSAARAAAGAGGLDVNSGSPAVVQNSIQQAINIDAANTMYKAKTRAYGAQISALNDEAQANVDQMGASTAQTAGMIGAFSSILGGAGKAFGQGMTGQSVGLAATAPLNLNPGAAAGDLGGNFQAGLL